MNRRTILAALGLGFAVAFAPIAAKAQSHHLTQAIAELKEGIHEGKQNLFSSFSSHVHNAYDHAKAASGHDPKGHIKVAMEHMRTALKVAKRTHHEHRLAAGVRHAENALIHLKVAAEHH